jgi:hypothetical protein
MKIQKILLFVLGFSCLGCEDLTDVENTIPEVNTGEVVRLTAREATIAVSGDDTDYYYMELSTQRSFGQDNTIRLDNIVAGQWQAMGLKPGTTYYYRQCASDGLTVITGPIRQFTTDPLVAINRILLKPWNSEVASEVITDEQMGIFFSDADSGQDFAGLINFRPSYDLQTGEWLMPFDVVPLETPHQFLAYAPYSSYIKDKTYIPIITSDGDIDYWSGKSTQTVTADHCSADIEMHHALARVIFKVSKDKDSNTDISVSEYALERDKNAGFYFPIRGYLDLVQDTIFVSYRNEYLPRTIPATTLSEEPVDMEFYVIPFAFTDYQLDFSIQTGKTYAEAYSSVIPATDWKAGYQYEYPVKVLKNSLVIGDVQVTPWTENGGGDIVIKN